MTEIIHLTKKQLTAKGAPAAALAFIKENSKCRKVSFWELAAGEAYYPSEGRVIGAFYNDSSLQFATESQDSVTAIAGAGVNQPIPTRAGLWMISVDRDGWTMVTHYVAKFTHCAALPPMADRDEELNSKIKANAFGALKGDPSNTLVMARGTSAEGLKGSLIALFIGCEAKIENLYWEIGWLTANGDWEDEERYTNFTVALERLKERVTVANWANWL